MPFTRSRRPAPARPDGHPPGAVQRHHRQLQRRRHRRLAHRLRSGPADRPVRLRVRLRRAPGRRLHVPRPRPRRDRATGGALDGTTATLTAAGLAAFPELKGPIPFDTGTYGYAAHGHPGAPFTPLLTNAAGHALAGVYQHPSTDPQAGVSELALTFDYNANQLQWLLLAPGLINWVTQDTHLGLYRNYFGQDVDDNFIADNEWSSQYQCTPAATDPPDYTCPGAQGVATARPTGAARRADERGRRGLRRRLGAADRDQAEPGVQRHRRLHRTLPPTSRAPTAPAASPIPRDTYTDPGQVVDPATRTTPGSSTPCWPTRPTSTGSPTPGRTCSSAAPCGSPSRSPGSRPTPPAARSPPAPTATRSPRPRPTASRSRPRRNR